MKLSYEIAHSVIDEAEKDYPFIQPIKWEIEKMTEKDSKDLIRHCYLDYIPKGLTKNMENRVIHWIYIILK